MGRVVQHAPPARAARVCSPGRVRAGVLQPPDGLGGAGRTHVTESPEKPARFMTAFERQRDEFMAEANTEAMNLRLGFLAHELRNLTTNAILAVAAIKRGNV